MTTDSSHPISDEQQDIRALLSAMHEDRKRAKEKEQRDGWTKYVSLMIVILAVATAIGSLKSAGYGAKVMLNQAKASDVWAHYQAKSVKQRLAEMEARTSSGAESTRAAADVVRYQKEQQELQAQAKIFESDRDEASQHGAPLGFAIASLQIAIALASVCLITKKKPLWGASSLLGLVGVLYLLFGLYGV